uniref:bacillithiol system redox-active protein YtxJ n=1 Tax=Polaribacter sp. TaxID=1920175 RepID=UPI0040486D4F
MSPFKNIFKNTKENTTQTSSTINWIPLESLEQLEEIESFSIDNTVLVFKHSTRCGVSSMVKRQFEKSLDENTRQMKLYYLDLISYREISNEIASRFNIRHQSPQLLLLKNGKVIDHASHHSILDVDLSNN